VYKLFFLGVLLVTACISLHAEESPFIYIAENAKVFNPNHIFAKQTDTAKNHKAAAKVENKITPAAAENKITEHEPDAVVLPAFPFAPSSSTFLQSGRESATITQQQRQDEQQSPAKACRGKTFQNISNADLSLYYPKQRQKLSPAATQCGMLTSFASTSPPPPCPLKGEKSPLGDLGVKAFFDIFGLYEKIREF